MTTLSTNTKDTNNASQKINKKIYNLKAEKLIREANDSFIYFKDYEMALCKIDDCLALDPENARAYILKGTIYFCLDELHTALESFERAIELEPSSVEAHSLKANILDIKGHLREALVSCDKAFINVTSSNYELLTSLYDQKLAILIKMKKYEQARQTLRQSYNYLHEEDSCYISSCYKDLIDSLHKKREEKKQIAMQRLKLVHSL